MKKILLIVLCILIMVAPTAALIVYYFTEDRSEEIVTSELVSAKITLADGSVRECKADDDQALVFLALHGSGDASRKPMTALPQDALSNEKYEVLYTDSFDVQTNFIYYMSADKDKCYYVDGEQQVYKISAKDAEGFLNSDLAESVYTFAKAPEIKLGDVVLEPSYLEWNYRTVGGMLRKASCSHESSGRSQEIGSFDAALPLQSGTAPDEVRLVIKSEENDARIFSGSKQAFMKTPIAGSIRVNVKMTLIWKESDALAYAGSAEYLFSGRLLGTPAFKFTTDTAKCGDVVILSAFNVSDPSGITIDVQPAFDFTPVFYPVKDTYQALIPLKYDLVSEKTDFTFTVSSASATDELTLTVYPLSTGAGEFKLYAPDAADYYNEQVLNNYHSAIDPILEDASDYSFAGGKFVIPTANNYISDTSNYSYGANVRIVNLKDAAYTAYDNMYCAQTRKVDDVYVEGNVTTVLAAFRGKVVYVGAQTFTGRMVIIDHGSGLKTVYTNLSSDIVVHKGDEVSAGQLISHAADGGFNDKMNFNFHVGAYVNGVPVALQQLIDRGLIAN